MACGERSGRLTVTVESGRSRKYHVVQKAFNKMMKRNTGGDRETQRRKYGKEARNQNS